jgi:hypothetical protein
MALQKLTWLPLLKADQMFIWRFSTMLSQMLRVKPATYVGTPDVTFLAFHIPTVLTETQQSLWDLSETIDSGTLRQAEPILTQSASLQLLPTVSLVVTNLRLVSNVELMFELLTVRFHLLSKSKEATWLEIKETIIFSQFP